MFDPMKVRLKSQNNVVAMAQQFDPKADPNRNEFRILLIEKNGPGKPVNGYDIEVWLQSSRKWMDLGVAIKEGFIMTDFDNTIFYEAPRVG